MTADSLNLAILNPSRYPEAEEARLAAWLGALLAEVAPDRDSFHLRLAGDRALRELNRKLGRQALEQHIVPTRQDAGHASHDNIGLLKPKPL